MDIAQKIEVFFESGPFAVVGASSNREKYGNKVLRCYLQHGHKVYPIHPTEKQIEGLACYPELGALPERPRSISIITPPRITEQVVEDAAEVGIEHVWMQPGAESPRAVARAEELGLSVIAGGPCLLVTLGFSDR